MPHHLLHDLGVGAGHCQPSAAGMPEAVKIGDFAFVVFIGQKVALLALGVFVGIVDRLGDPILTRLGQIVAQHTGKIRFVGQVEHRRLGRFSGDVGLQACR
nr:hypothetical protein [Lignipirellula cremea]